MFNQEISEREKSKSSNSLVVAGIPALNEERSIAKIILETQKYVDVVLVCDDGSSDYTANIAEHMGAYVMKHKRNLGYGAAMKSLLNGAMELNADVLVTLDADGQHDPKNIPELIKPVMEDKADVVLGCRNLKNDSSEIPRYRRWGINLISKITGAAFNQKVTDAQCGYRVFGRKAISELRLIEKGMGASVELFMKAKKHGLIVAEVSTDCKYNNLERTSTKNPFRHGASVISSILRLVIEERPLTFLGLPGLVSLLVGISFGFWLIQLYIDEQRVVTNVALAALSFVLIGMFMIFTSITLYAINRLNAKKTTYI